MLLIRFVDKTQIIGIERAEQLFYVTPHLAATHVKTFWWEEGGLAGGWV